MTAPDLTALGRWVAGLRPADLPPSVAERTRLQIAAGIAAVLDGSRFPAVRTAADAWGAGPPSSRARSRRREGTVDAEALAPRWALASMALDFDDYLLFAHPGHSAVNVALATALGTSAPLGDLCAAVAAADEVAGRFGGLALLGPHNGQQWAHVHAAAAVAAAGRIHGDPPDVVERAVGIAFALPPFLLPPAFFGGDTKILTAALPIDLGLRALRLARRTGLAAPADLLGAADGFGRHFAYAPIEGFLEGWGETWLTESLAVKRTPGCAYLSAATEAARDVSAQFRAAKGRPLAASDVERVDLSATALTLGMEKAAAPWRRGPLGPVEVTFSSGLSVAVALLDGDLTAGALHPERLARDEAVLRETAARVHVRHDPRRTMRFVEGVVGPMALADALGDLRGDAARKAGWEILRRYAGALRPGERGATVEPTPGEGPAGLGALAAFRQVGRLLSGALERRRDGVRYSVARARPAAARFAASAGMLAVLAGEAFEGECEIPPGAPGAQVGLDAVVRERVARSFAAAGVEADAETFVGALLGAPDDADPRALLEPVLPALDAR
jgi:2-methylcitrate dehydratase PrpD